MIKINILTIFPELYTAMQQETIVRKAIENKQLELNLINFRDFSIDKHNKVDDYPYGGGEGMLLKIQPIDSAIEYFKLASSRLIYTSPKGVTLDQNKIYELSAEKEITILVGRYEGIDQRVFEKYQFEEISIGDFILSGGDLLAQVLIDSIARVLPGVLNNQNSFKKDTFTQPLLEHHQYTRPEQYQGMKVPEILLSGHHKNIEEWILNEQLKETKLKRPDIYQKYLKSKKDNESRKD